jgi:hypothetical protein
MVYRSSMSFSRFTHAGTTLALLTFGSIVFCCAATAQSAAAPAATNLPAQSLKLIPMPRELSVGPIQSLASGVQITCVAPCASEDSFAIDDLKAYPRRESLSTTPHRSTFWSRDTAPRWQTPSTATPQQN